LSSCALPEAARAHTLFGQGTTFMAPPSFSIVIAGIFLVAGFVKGVIGLGLPTVSVGLLGLMMTPSQAAAIVVLPSLVTNVWQCGGKGFSALLWRIWPMLAGIAVGTFIGAILLPHGGTEEATIWLGIALAIYAGLGLFKLHFVVPPRAEWWLGPLIGVGTGIVTVATGVFVLPCVPYVQALQMDRDKLVQAMGISFTVSTITMAAALAHAGAMSGSIAGVSLIALAAGLAGMVLGQIVRGKVAAKTFRLCFFIGLLLLGAHLALRSVM